MPISFNEVVPTITDILEYSEVEKEDIEKLLDSSYFIADDVIDMVMLRKEFATNLIIDYFNNNSITNKIKEFLSTTNSKYIAWL